MTDTKSTFNWQVPPDWIWRAVAFLLAVGVLVLITTRWNRRECPIRGGNRPIMPIFSPT